MHGFERCVPRPAVPGHVGEQLGRREVGDGLDGGRRPVRDVGDQLDGDRAAVRQRGERVGQAVVEHRRVDAAGQRPQVGDRLERAAVRVLDELGDAGQVDAAAVVQLLPGQAELHGQGHELRLGAVVQVPLDAAQPRRGIVHDARPALLKRLDPLRGRAAAEQAAHQPPVDLGEAVRRPRGDDQQEGAEREEAERAGQAGDPVTDESERPPRREGRADQAAQPAGRDDAEPGDGKRELQREVGARPPGDRVEDARAHPFAQLVLRPQRGDRDARLGGQLGDPLPREPSDRDPGLRLPHPGLAAGLAGRLDQAEGVGRGHLHPVHGPEQRRRRDFLAEQPAGKGTGRHAEPAHGVGRQRPQRPVEQRRDDERDRGDREREAGEGIAELRPGTPGEGRLGHLPQR